MYLAAFASGAQNGLLTSLTGFARTTHLTGTITDIGLLLGQATNPEKRNHKNHWWKVWTLTKYMIAYIAGANCAMVFFQRRLAVLHNYAMFIPALGYLLLALIGYVHCLRTSEEQKGSRPKDGLPDSQETNRRLSNTVVKDATATLNTMVAELYAEAPNIDNIEPDSVGRTVTCVSMAPIFRRSKPSSDYLTKEELYQLFQFLASNPNNVLEAIQDMNPRVHATILLMDGSFTAPPTLVFSPSQNSADPNFEDEASCQTFNLDQSSLNEISNEDTARSTSALLRSTIHHLTQENL